MFLVIATGLIAYDPPWRSRARAPIVAAFASLLAVICVVQLSVSMRDTGLTYGWEYFTFLSPHVVIGFFTLACALFARAWTDDQQRRPAGPSWIPIPIAAVLICATFVLWHALRVEEWEHLQEQTQTETVEMKEALTEATRQHMHAMVRVASRWQHAGTARARAGTRTRRCCSTTIPACTPWRSPTPDFSLRWITANGQPDRIRALEGFNLLSERHRAIAANAAKATRRPVISKPIQLWDEGALGFLIICPVYGDDGTFRGTGDWRAARRGRVLAAAVRPRVFPADQGRADHAVSHDRRARAHRQHDVGVARRHLLDGDGLAEPRAPPAARVDVPDHRAWRRACSPASSSR